MTRADAQTPGGEPIDELTITDLAAVKVLADPVRLRVLEAATARPMTAKEVATALGVTPHNLYYHLGLLTQRGLLALVPAAEGTKGERRYRSVAKRIRIDRAKVAITAPLTARDRAEGIEAVFSLFLHETGRDLRAAVRDGAIDLDARVPDVGALLLKRDRLRLTREQARHVSERLRQLAAELDEGGERSKAAGDSPDSTSEDGEYLWFVGFHRLTAGREPAVDDGREEG